MTQVFQAYPVRVSPKILALRELIFSTPVSTEVVGEIEEARQHDPHPLKNSNPSQYAMYFHCQTNLVETFRVTFPKEFRFEGKRAIVFKESEPMPTGSLAFCIAVALSYHRTKGLQGPAPMNDASACEPPA